MNENSKDFEKAGSDSQMDVDKLYDKQHGSYKDNVYPSTEPTPKSNDQIDKPYK